jgi:hypothetical protein
VFTSERGGSADLYRIKPDETALERLTDSPADDDQAAFSPDHGAARRERRRALHGGRSKRSGKQQYPRQSPSQFGLLAGHEAADLSALGYGVRP